MKKDRDELDDLFRSKLYDYEADTFPEDWEAIEKRLPRPSVSMPRRTWYYGAVAAVAALLVAISGIYFNKDEIKTEQLAEQTRLITQPIPAISETNPESGQKVLAQATPKFQAVKEMLDYYLANPAVDKSRIYIIGLSMGAMGTFDMVARFPDIFAAAVPICGIVNPDRLSVAKNVSFRIFHGDADNIVPVEGSREAYKVLKSIGASVEYIEFPGCNHGSWNPAFNYPDFMEWIFKQKKK